VNPAMNSFVSVKGPSRDGGISPATATRAPERLRPEAFSPSLACRL
jgi:hypothetical protein